MIKENEFFYEENICLYEYEDKDDGEMYYDFNMMYQSALHPEEIDVLISVLEELQAKENN